MPNPNQSAQLLTQLGHKGPKANPLGGGTQSRIPRLGPMRSWFSRFGKWLKHKAIKGVLSGNILISGIAGGAALPIPKVAELMAPGHSVMRVQEAFKNRIYMIQSADLMAEFGISNEVLNKEAVSHGFVGATSFSKFAEFKNVPKEANVLVVGSHGPYGHGGGQYEMIKFKDAAHTADWGSIGEIAEHLKGSNVRQVYLTACTSNEALKAYGFETGAKTATVNGITFYAPGESGYGMVQNEFRRGILLAGEDMAAVLHAEGQKLPGFINFETKTSSPDFKGEVDAPRLSESESEQLAKQYENLPKQGPIKETIIDNVGSSLEANKPITSGGPDLINTNHPLNGPVQKKALAGVGPPKKALVQDGPPRTPSSRMPDPPLTHGNSVGENFTFNSTFREGGYTFGGGSAVGASQAFELPGASNIPRSPLIESNIPLNERVIQPRPQPVLTAPKIVPSTTPIPEGLPAVPSAPAAQPQPRRRRSSKKNVVVAANESALPTQPAINPGPINQHPVVERMRGAAAKAPVAEPTQIAWHGSHADFNKFDIKYLGTGEGLQAGGHGLYFTENPSLLQWYKNLRAPKGATGNTYKVKIPHADTMLDLNAEFQYQSSFIQEKLAEFKNVKIPGFVPQLGLDSPTGLDFYRHLSKTLGSDRAASEYLLERGIKGNVWDDLTSKQGHRNFTVFNDADIEILEKNGKSITPESTGPISQTAVESNELLQPGPKQRRTGAKPAPALTRLAPPDESPSLIESNQNINKSPVVGRMRPKRGRVQRWMDRYQKTAPERRKIWMSGVSESGFKSFQRERRAKLRAHTERVKERWNRRYGDKTTETQRKYVERVTNKQRRETRRIRQRSIRTRRAVEAKLKANQPLPFEYEASFMGDPAAARPPVAPPIPEKAAPPVEPPPKKKVPIPEPQVKRVKLNAPVTPPPPPPAPATPPNTTVSTNAPLGPSTQATSPPPINQSSVVTNAAPVPASPAAQAAQQTVKNVAPKAPKKVKFKGGKFTAGKLAIGAAIGILGYTLFTNIFRRKEEKKDNPLGPRCNLAPNRVEGMIGSAHKRHGWFGSGLQVGAAAHQNDLLAREALQQHGFRINTGFATKTQPFIGGGLQGRQSRELMRNFEKHSGIRFQNRIDFASYNKISEYREAYENVHFRSVGGGAGHFDARSKSVHLSLEDPGGARVHIRTEAGRYAHEMAHAHQAELAGTPENFSRAAKEEKRRFVKDQLNPTREEINRGYKESRFEKGAYGVQDAMEGSKGYVTDYSNIRQRYTNLQKQAAQFTSPEERIAARNQRRGWGAGNSPQAKAKAWAQQAASATPPPPPPPPPSLLPPPAPAPPPVAPAPTPTPPVQQKVQAPATGLNTAATPQQAKPPKPPKTPKPPKAPSPGNMAVKAKNATKRVKAYSKGFGGKGAVIGGMVVGVGALLMLCNSNSKSKEVRKQRVLTTDEKIRGPQMPMYPE